MFNDLREYLDRAKEIGEYKVIEGADWDLEIGAITEMALSRPDLPLLIFDKIKDYKAGYRVVTNFLNTSKLVALAFGLPLEAKGIELVRAWRDRTREALKPLPSLEVKTGPVKENVLSGTEVNLYEFPVPKWHEHDGGRYIGTGNTVIQKDPDEGWVNLGTYRVQIHDRDIATIYMSPGRHGDMIRRKYWEKGLSCPVAVVCGQDPLLWTISHSAIPWGVSEYEYVGGLRHKPVEVVKGQTTGLPIPAGAEIVLEGELVPPGTETKVEGPFGEYTGYYASGSKAESIFRVKSIMHRNDPIILGAPPQVGSFDLYFGKNIMRAALIWNELDKNVPGVKGVWLPTEARGPSMVIISVEQKYAGHAKQAAMFATSQHQGAYMCRFAIVVDDDIDPSNISEVLWALGTRCEPETSIDIVRECWGTPLDTMLPPEKRSRRDYSHSEGIIVACRPYYWIKDFPPSIKGSPELLKKTQEKWGRLVFGEATPGQKKP